MKPTKNKFHCLACGRTKMLFESEAKADNFIRFNSDEILEETGKTPVRSYYCSYCGGWHVTSNPDLEYGAKLDFKDKRVYQKLELSQDLIEQVEKELIEINRCLDTFDIDTAGILLSSCKSRFEHIGKNGVSYYKIQKIYSKLGRYQSKFDEYVQYYNMSNEEQEARLMACDPKKVQNLRYLINSMRARKYFNGIIQNRDVLVRSDDEIVHDIIVLCMNRLNEMNLTKAVAKHYTKLFNSILTEHDNMKSGQPSNTEDAKQ